MKKIFLVITLILCFVVLLTGCKNNENKTQNTLSGENVQNIPENSLMLDTETPISKIDEKTFEITPDESGEVKIGIKKVSGEIDVEILDGEGFIVELITGSDIGEEGESKSLYIEEGNGEYKLKVTTEEFIGSYEVSWTKSNVSEMITYDSAQGYSIVYDKKKIDLKQDNGKDVFVLTSTDRFSENAEGQSMTISIVSSENADSVKEKILTEDARIGDATMANSTIYGKYVEETNEETGLTERTFVMNIEGGRLLLIEQNYNEFYNLGNAAKRFGQMCETIKIK